MLEKRNVVEGKRTPEHELDRPDSNWDKEAAAEFVPVKVKSPKHNDTTPRSAVVERD